MSSALCSPCAQGRWSADEGADSIEHCTACPKGRNSPAVGASTPAACGLCANGTFSLSGAMSCADCLPGKPRYLQYFRHTQQS